MAKNRLEKDGSIVLPPLAGSDRDDKSPRKDGPGKKETPKQMIRSLQHIFCKGRYSSWTARQ
jgi:hypothetical protein